MTSGLSDPAGEGTNPPVRPRWVKFFLGIAALVAIAVVVGLLVGGDHGPGRHLGGSTDHGAPAGQDAPGHRPPVGGHSP